MSDKNEEKDIKKDSSADENAKNDANRYDAGSVSTEGISPITAEILPEIAEKIDTPEDSNRALTYLKTLITLHKKETKRLDYTISQIRLYMRHNQFIMLLILAFGFLIWCLIAGQKSMYTNLQGLSNRQGAALEYKDEVINVMRDKLLRIEQNNTSLLLTQTILTNKLHAMQSLTAEARQTHAQALKESAVPLQASLDKMDKEVNAFSTSINDGIGLIAKNIESLQKDITSNVKTEIKAIAKPSTAIQEQLAQIAVKIEKLQQELGSNSTAQERDRKNLDACLKELAESLNQLRVEQQKRMDAMDKLLKSVTAVKKDEKADNPPEQPVPTEQP